MTPGTTIGLDARSLDLVRGTGVATYAATIAGCLPGLGLGAEFLRAGATLPRAARWAAACWPGPFPSWTAPGVRLAADPFRIAQVFFDVHRRPLVLTGRKLPAVMHWTYPLPLRLAGRPNLYTVHDLIPLLRPELTGIPGERFGRLLRAVLRRADGVVTVSEATRGELVRELGLDPALVVNTGQAVEVSGAVDAGVPGLERRGYWLHVGAVEKRKNLVRLLEAWRAGGGGRPLVLAGPDGWRGEEALAAAAAFMGNGEGPCVVRVPWLERRRLLGLIRDARALLMPSLSEGFGLPVAEAMALGTPVLCSRGGALEEVAGGAALLADPLDVADLASGLRALDADAERRAELAEAGRRRAVVFGPQAYAARLAALYGRFTAPAPFSWTPPGR